MTYCLGMSLHGGLVMMADTRTNSGIDNFATYRKLHLYENWPDRVFAIASAGSLSVTQTALAMLDDGVEHPLTGRKERLGDAPDSRHAAQLAGAALRQARTMVTEKFSDQGANYVATLLFGGRVGNERHSLFLIYNPGNALEAGTDTPFMQIGELKYGKPILDRALRHDTAIPEAIKLGLLSFDGAIRSNLSVAPPIDLAVLSTDGHHFTLKRRIEADDPYWTGLSRQWADALAKACAGIAPPEWLNPPAV